MIPWALITAYFWFEHMHMMSNFSYIPFLEFQQKSLAECRVEVLSVISEWSWSKCSSPITIAVASVWIRAKKILKFSLKLYIRSLQYSFYISTLFCYAKYNQDSLFKVRHKHESFQLSLNVPKLYSH